MLRWNGRKQCPKEWILGTFLAVEATKSKRLTLQQSPALLWVLTTLPPQPNLELTLLLLVLVSKPSSTAPMTLLESEDLAWE